MRNLYLTNTLSRQKELFVPQQEGHAGMYVCGPTVYGDAHLGHARPGVTYDVLFKLLRHLGYKVRYVRNITDVGHLEHDADEGGENDDPAEALSALSAMTGTEIPAPLARVLTLPVRFTGSVSPDRMEDAIFS